DDRRDHLYEERMAADGRRADHPHPRLAGDPRGCDIEIVEHLDVIAHKADRHDDRGSSGAQVANRVTDIGFEPGLARVPAAALKGERPGLDAGRTGDQPRRFAQLLDVPGPLRHRDRDAVSGENEMNVRMRVRVETPQRFRHARSCGLYEQRMRVPRAGVIDLRRRDSGLLARVADVLLVAIPARLAAMRRHDKSERSPYSARGHLAYRAGEIRLPVAHPDEH